MHNVSRLHRVKAPYRLRPGVVLILAGALTVLALSLTACKSVLPLATATPAVTRATEDAATPTAEPTAPPELMFDIDRLLAGPRAYGADPFCLQLADTDADGELEWVGLRTMYAEESTGVVSGFVLDGDNFYPLGAASGNGAGDLIVGNRPHCDVSVEDLNGDGSADIAFAGQSDAGAHSLVIFSWNEGEEYQLLGSFGGTAGVELDDDDGDGIPDVVTRNCVAPGVALKEVSRWEGAAYRFSRNYYDEVPDCVGDSAPDRPDQVLIAYYLMLNRRELETAYGLLSESAQMRQPYRDYVLSIAAVRRYYLGQIDDLSMVGDEAIIRGLLLTEHATGGSISRTAYAGEWHLRRVETDWRIEQILLSNP
jgi:hypothetical protein